MTISISFTGTQQGLVSHQEKALFKILHESSQEHDEVTCHHGCCIGADEEFASMCRFLSERATKPWKIIGYPSTIFEKTSQKAMDLSDEVLPRKHPLKRNVDIVQAGNLLLACPKETVEVLRSGTWSTTRAMRKLGRKIVIIYPTGVIKRV